LVDEMNNLTIYFVMRCKAFSGEGIYENKISVDEKDTVRVYDSVAGYYTDCNSLSSYTKRKARAYANTMRG